MKLVPKCSTGRVLLLKFRDSTSRRFFYWMQEPKEDKDETLITKVSLVTVPDSLRGRSESGQLCYVSVVSVRVCESMCVCVCVCVCVYMCVCVG